MMVIRKSGKACCILLVLFQTSLSAGDFRNWKELRDTGIEKQNLDVSCGAAAAATILRAYYGVAVSEQEILAEVIKAGLDVTASDLEQDLMTEIILTALSGAQTIEDLTARPGWSYWATPVGEIGKSPRTASRRSGTARFCSSCQRMMPVTSMWSAVSFTLQSQIP